MIRRPARAALVAWVLFAFVVWNVVFDRVLVVAGRQYVAAAAAADVAPGPRPLAADWMLDAQRRALWAASAAAGGVLAVGAIPLVWVRRRSREADDRRLAR
jgi:hypothetical protein